MATRTKTSGKTKSAASPPLAGSVLERNDDTTRNNQGAHEAARNERSDASVTSANLERRDIPSFSNDREARIAEAAYWRSERRGFEPGHELEDWLEAEREIDGSGSQNDESARTQTSAERSSGM